MINILNKKFHKGQRGSISIMLVIVMVPVLLLSSMLVDIVRVKSYSQDALMAADNYAEAYLAEYNNVLKQLYGLYAISGSMAGNREIQNYKNVVLKNFSPDNSSFTPYNNLNITLEEKMVSDSTLSHRHIIRSQIGDFMRFRIAQMLLMDGEEIMQSKEDAKEASSIADKADILEAKTEFDEKYANAVATLLKYYDQLEKFHDLQGLDEEMKKALLDGVDEFNKVAKDQVDAEKAKEAEEYQKWQKENEGKEEKDRTEFSGLSKDDKAKLRKDNGVEAKFDEAIGGIQDTQKKYGEKMKDLSQILDDMEKECENVIKKMKELDSARNKFFKKLDEYKGTDTQVIESMREAANKAFEDIGANGTTSGDGYKKIVERLKNDRDIPDQINDRLKDAYEKLNDDKSKFVKADIDDVYDRSAFEPIKDIPWETVEATISTATKYHDEDKNVYERLKKLHDAYGNITEEEAQKKLKEATDAQNEQIKKLEELIKGDKPDKKARDVPKGLGKEFGDESTVPELEGLWDMIKGIFKNAKSMFKDYDKGLEGWGLQMISRLYVPYYDFGMFTCRTTGKVAGKKQQTVSLTGLVQDGSNHWMYGAEIEYILCHHREAEKNLRQVKSWVITARIVLNYWATYQVKWIDTPIKVLAGIAAIVGAYKAVDTALRIAVMAAETAADWSILSDGGKIVFNKKEGGDLSAIDALKSILDVSDGAPNKDQKGSKYWSYIKFCKAFMMLWVTPEEVVDRTAHVIMINTNYIIMGENAFKNVKSKKALKVNFDTAYTAVEVTAKVNSKNVVMDTGWQRWVSPETSTAVNNIFGRQYTYTVIRGY